MIFFYSCRQLYPDMPEDILNNIRAFVRNQSASSLMQMMQNNQAINIVLQQAEPILNMINMNNSTIHHSQDSNQTVSNTTHHSDQNIIQNQTVSHTTDESQNTQTWQDRLLKAWNENHGSDDESDNEDLEGDFLKIKTTGNYYQNFNSSKNYSHFRMMFAVALLLIVTKLVQVK